MPKLHIPGPSGYAITACGRQLNNHRNTRVQDTANVVLADTAGAYFDSLDKGKACRHCGRAVGLLPKIARSMRNSPDGEDE